MLQGSTKSKYLDNPYISVLMEADPFIGFNKYSYSFKVKTTNL